MSLVRRAFSGTVAGLVSLVAQIGLQLASVPILLRAWGEETYGLWLVVSSLYALLITLDTGHQGFVGAELLKTVGVDDDEAREHLQSGVQGALVLAALELGAASTLYLGGWLDEATSAPPARLGEVSTAIAVLLGAWLCIGSAGGVLVRLYLPMGEFARATWLGIGQRSSMSLAVIGAAALGGGLVAAACAMAAASSLWGLAVFADLRRFRRHRPFLGDRVHGPRIARNLRGSLALTATGLITQAQQHGLLLILGASAIGPSAVALFATTRTVANLFLQGASTLVAPLSPDLVRAHVERRSGRLATLLVLLSAAGVAASTLGMAVVLPGVEYLYASWTRSALRFDMSLFALLAATVVVRCSASPALSLLQGTNALRPQLVLATVQTSVTLGAAAVLSRADGIRGTCAALLVGEVLGSWVVVPLAVRGLHDALVSNLPRRATALVLGASGVGLIALTMAAYTTDGAWTTSAMLGVCSMIGAMGAAYALPHDLRARVRATMSRSKGP